MKELGFNMIRKHIKIEPQRWYYHCDRLGMLVWQDMVCGGTSYRHWFVTYMATLFNALHWSVNDGKQSRSLLSRREEEGQKLFYSETRDTIEALYNHPSIVCWVPLTRAGDSLTPLRPLISYESWIPGGSSTMPAAGLIKREATFAACITISFP